MENETEFKYGRLCEQAHTLVRTLKLILKETNEPIAIELIGIIGPVMKKIESKYLEVTK